MEITDIISSISQFGFAGAIVAYFLYRDSKFMNKLLSLMEKISEGVDLRNKLDAVNEKVVKILFHIEETELPHTGDPSPPTPVNKKP